MSLPVEWIPLHHHWWSIGRYKGRQEAEGKTTHLAIKNNRSAASHWKLPNLHFLKHREVYADRRVCSSRPVSSHRTTSFQTFSDLATLCLNSPKGFQRWGSRPWGFTYLVCSALAGQHRISSCEQIIDNRGPYAVSHIPAADARSTTVCTRSVSFRKHTLPKMSLERETANPCLPQR